jgi:acyl-CoA reductase-like NAD-dependent aldehyde dehydrogenase
MIDVINPATEKVFTIIPWGTAEDVDRAAARAKIANGFGTGADRA